MSLQETCPPERRKCPVEIPLRFAMSSILTFAGYVATLATQIESDLQTPNFEVGICNDARKGVFGLLNE